MWVGALQASGCLPSSKPEAIAVCVLIAVVTFSCLGAFLTALLTCLVFRVLGNHSAKKERKFVPTGNSHDRRL